MAGADGGDLVAETLARHGVQTLFTLCGGHISPILVRARARGIRVVDVRDEASAVFAADATARLTGRWGVAAVTAGPGVTNAVTAVQNARLAQSPVVVLGGAAPTLLQGRGALQDMDHARLLRCVAKRAWRVRLMRDLVPVLESAFRTARAGVPGPVFVECPVDCLYPEPLVRGWYGRAAGGAGAAERLRRWYLRRHLDRLFADGGPAPARQRREPSSDDPDPAAVRRVAAALGRAERPVLLVGSQATLDAATVGQVAAAVEGLGVPAYLTGMARGLLGRAHPLLLRHARREALGEADLVLLAGVPCDFRLDYGRQIGRRAVLVSVNRSAVDLRRNRAPALGVRTDPGRFLIALSGAAGPRSAWVPWLAALRARDAERERQITELAAARGEYVNPLALCRAVDAALPEDAVVVADGGDFVATASYVVAPRRPLGWLDPGPFGTLGVGGGFALGARLACPDAEVWLLYGDGAAAYSLAEFDTFVRHGLGLVAVVGTDGAWTQIAREQVELLGDPVGTVLRRTAYEQVAEGYGGRGFRVEAAKDLEPVLREARDVARTGVPVLVNVLIGTSPFRKGAIAM